MPRPLALDPAASPLWRARSYSWSAYSFPPAADTTLPNLEVAGVFGFPLEGGAPLAFGYGARPALRDALDAAMRETAQLLAFTWGEPIPEHVPEPAPTPLAHLERFQCPETHGRLRRWLDGAHAAHARPAAVSTAATPVKLVDLTPAWLQGRFAVARAVCRSAIPMTFGESPFFAHLPPELRVHPIP